MDSKDKKIPFKKIMMFILLIIFGVILYFLVRNLNI